MFVLDLEFTEDQRRLTARPAHREGLQALRNDGRLLMAGPWGDDSGALLVFDTDRRDMEQILADDPYYATPGVQVRSLREWQPIVCPPASGKDT